MPVLLLMGSLAIPPPGTHIACAVHIIMLLHVSFLSFPIFLLAILSQPPSCNTLKLQVGLLSSQESARLKTRKRPWAGFTFSTIQIKTRWVGQEVHGPAFNLLTHSPGMVAIEKVQSRWHYTKPLTMYTVSKAHWMPYLLHISERENVKQNANWEGSAVTIDTLWGRRIYVFL